MDGPDKYVAGTMPDMIPRLITKEDVKSLFSQQLELKGYCPVTFKDGPSGFSGIIPGDLDCVVECSGKLYAMRNIETRAAFMKEPWNYIGLELPAKLPPLIAPVPVGQLPMIGYLEQTVARTLTQALCEVGAVKPSHPFKSVDRSACEFLGLYLKGFII